MTRNAKTEILRAELLETYRAIRPVVEARLEEFRRAGDEADPERLFEELVFCLFTPQTKARMSARAVAELKASGLLWSGSAEEISAALPIVRFRHTKARHVVRAREQVMGERQSKDCKDGKDCKDKKDDGKKRDRRDGRDNRDNGNNLEKKSKTNRSTMSTMSTMSTSSISSMQSIDLAEIISMDPADARQRLVAEVKGIGFKEATHFLRNVGRAGDLAILDRHILKNLRGLGAIRALPKTMTPRHYLRIERAMQRLARKLDMPIQHLDLVLWYRETGEVFK